MTSGANYQATVQKLASAQVLSDREIRAAKREGRKQRPDAIKKETIRTMRVRYDRLSSKLRMKNFRARSSLEKLFLVEMHRSFWEELRDMGVPLPSARQILLEAGHVTEEDLKGRGR